MKTISLFAIMIFTIVGAYSQNLIGYNDVEIKEYMKENHMDMNPHNVTNNSFKYLKYSDNYENQTLLFFLDPNLICQSVRLICESRFKEEKVKEFNSIYKISGKNRWIDNRDGKDYIIEISDEKWFCVINIVQKNN